MKEMRPYWVTFKGREPGCMEAKDIAEAARLAREVTGFEVVSCSTLPYPADPRIGEKSDCPPFCWQPGTCKGRTSCLNNPACDN